MAWCSRGLPLGVGLLLFVGCGDDSGDKDSPDDTGGNAGTSAAGKGGAGGSSGGTRAGSAGEAGESSGGSDAGSGGSETSAGGNGSGGTSAGGETGEGGAGAGPAADQCVEITTFETGLEPEMVLHVTVNGSASPDGSEENPYGSIMSAITAADPGTAIRIHPGQYSGSIHVSGVEGTAEAPIWIGGAPGEEPPVIGMATDNVAIQLASARYVVLHDLVIAETTGNGLNIDDSGNYADPEALSHIVFRNLSIRDIGTGDNNDCLKLSGANDFWVLDSEFRNCSLGGSGIDMVGCHDGLIARNRFVGGGNAVQTKGGSENVEIRGNRFVQNDGRAVNLGGSTGFEFFRPPLSTTEDNAEARDIRLVANVFDRPTEAIAFVGCVDCLAANNTVYLPTTRVIRILQETVSDATYTFLPASNGSVVNNVFFFTRAEVVNDGRAINIGADTSADTFAYTNNLWFASDDAAASEPSSAYGGATVTGTLSPEDPAFADAANGNFAIDAESPAAAAGVDLEGVPADFRGACYGTPRAVGAVEVLEGAP